MIAAFLAALALAAAPDSAPSPAAVPAAPAAPAPSPEAVALARRAAARDDFLVMIQSVAGGQVEGVEKGMGELTPAEKAKVDEIGKRKLDEGIDRVVDRLAVVYAKEFSLDDLRAIDAFLQTPAGKAYSERLLPTLTVVGEAMKGFDFKREVRAQACAEIKKGCEDGAPMKMPPPVKGETPPPKP
ncbi:MAG TPA: DUF2059 domain-containing protein [Caulobacteraceae bacterium]|nr:DUF2059 domain-containing protein [Caulobacteraceae bacterium]